MPSEEDIAQQLRLLTAHRRTLSAYLEQLALLGGSPYAPPSILAGMREGRAEIARIKVVLRQWGMDVEDHPNDEEPPQPPNTSPTLVRVDDEERQTLRELLRTHQRRLRVLELQRATKGASTPPEVITEIEDIGLEIRRIESELEQLTPPTDRAANRQRRGDALAAFYRKDWEAAEELIELVIEANPGDGEMQRKLQQVQRELELRAAYNALRRLRDDGMWEALLNAMDDLAQEYPGTTTFPDMVEMRTWAEYRKQRAERYAAVVTTLEAVITTDPGDETARALLTQARAARDEGR